MKTTSTGEHRRAAASRQRSIAATARSASRRSRLRCAYQSEAKNPAYAPVAWRHDDERCRRGGGLTSCRRASRFSGSLIAESARDTLRLSQRAAAGCSVDCHWHCVAQLSCKNVLRLGHQLICGAAPLIAGTARPMRDACRGETACCRSMFRTAPALIASRCAGRVRARQRDLVRSDQPDPAGRQARSNAISASRCRRARRCRRSRSRAVSMSRTARAT